MSVTKANREARMLQIIDLLTAQTRDGTLEWTEGFGASYKTILGNQVIILDRDYDSSSPTLSEAMMAAMSLKGVSLEIRGRTGEIAEKVELPEPTQSFLFNQESPVFRYSNTVFRKLNALYDLVDNRKEVLANQAIDDVLNTLQKRAK